MPDLTRFDFYAMRFMYSEDVRSMSAEEVGQYILLLCESWLSGKGASLPDDLCVIDTWARGKVSDRVLAKFPLVETEFGNRRRNPVLHTEWVKVLERQEIASENGRRGGTASSVYKADAARENGKLGGRPSTRNNPTETQAITQTQAEPSRTKPNQTNECDFKNIAVRYRRAFHVNLSHGTIQKKDYSEACSQFGEDAILEQFETWAPENLWIKERHHTNGLRQFYEALPAMIEASAAIQKDEQQKKESEENQKDSITLSVALGHASFKENEAELIRVRDEEEALAEKLKDNPFGDQ